MSGYWGNAEATAAASVLGSLNLSNSQLLPLIAARMGAYSAGPEHLAANFHLAFNLALSLVFLPLLSPVAKLAERYLPAARAGEDPKAPRHLDRALLAAPPLQGVHDAGPDLLVRVPGRGRQEPDDLLALEHARQRLSRVLTPGRSGCADQPGTGW